MDALLHPPDGIFKEPMKKYTLLKQEQTELWGKNF